MLENVRVLAQARPCDAKTYNRTISACTRSRLWPSALQVFAMWQDRGGTPNVFIYSATISACEKVQQWQNALRLLAEMPSAGVAADVVTYSAAISACEKGQQHRELLHIASDVVWLVCW